jgi:predicted nucleic acid-binding protein
VFEDEARPWTDELLDRLRGGDRIIVLAHWPTEISNGMLMAVRRKRILPGRPQLFWEQLRILPIDVEMPLSADQAKAVLALGERYGLTVYDAAYLKLATRKGLPLATLDSALIQAAKLEGASVLQEPAMS